MDVELTSAKPTSQNGDCCDVVVTNYGVLRDGEWRTVFGHFDESVVDAIKTFAQRTHHAD